MNMHFSRTQAYDRQFLQDNMMGPNSMKMLEELVQMPWMPELKPEMRVLDLGCGKGLTSIFLAREYGLLVFATDLWISATENFARFKEAGLDKSVIPIHADAADLPFADEYFDVIVSIDAYHYFGRDEGFLDEKIAPLLKSNGTMAIAVPGLRKEIRGNNIPAEMLLSWDAEDIKTFQSPEWWRSLLSKSEQMEILAAGELNCYPDCWKDWLECENEYAISDRKAMSSGVGAYMNLVYVIAKKR
jgi:cyclopropane fatty-acyl-phospholipid synthase-like methyltransferase